MKKIALAVLFALAAPLSLATTLLQGNATTDTSSNSYFDTASFMFTPEFVDTISIANTAQGFGHNHGGLSQGLLEIYDGTTWIIVDQFVLGNQAFFSTTFSSPVTFVGDVISGLRLTDTLHVGYAYHDVSSNMTYTISGTPSNVPEPATIALLGLGMLGIATSRRKSAK